MAKQLNLDLGSDDMAFPCGCSEPKKVFYPSFHYSGPTKVEVPDEGIMTIRYCKTNSSVNVDHERDKKRYSCGFDVKEIISAEADEVEAPAKRDRSSEESLDALMAEKSSKKGY